MKGNMKQDSERESKNVSAKTMKNLTSIKDYIPQKIKKTVTKGQLNKEFVIL